MPTKQQVIAWDEYKRRKPLDLDLAQAKECYKRAYEWLDSITPWDFGKDGFHCRWRLRYNVSRARFHWHTRSIDIDARRNFWLTYHRPSVGRYANMIPCSWEESITLQFVHELTHSIQFLRCKKSRLKIRMPEVETTQNELRFALENYPHLFRETTLI